MKFRIHNPINSIVIGWLLLQFFLLIFLTHTYPLSTPITDDWLYLGLGSHQEMLLSNSLLELVNGHQQVLVKVVVWFLGCFPISYLQTFWVLNILLVLSGSYFLIMAYINSASKKPKIYQIATMLLLICNYKALYLYLSITGMGLCMTYFLYGLYFYAPSRFSANKARKIQIAIAFLSPFTTGFGLSLTLFHLILLAKDFIKNKFRFSRAAVSEIVFLSGSFLLSYVFPTILGLFNTRSPGHSSNFVSKLINVLVNPINDLKFLAGLVGSVLTPSSRLDPQLPIAVGAIAFFSILLIYMANRHFDNRISLHTTTESTPLLPSIIFMFLLIIFRGSEGSTNLIESSAPRYVLGSSLFLFSCYLLLISNLTLRNKTTQVVIIASSIFLTMSVAGTKTGLEWIKVRSKQSYELNQCLELHSNSSYKCISSAWEIREGDSDFDQVRVDLDKLIKYKS